MTEERLRAMAEAAWDGPVVPLWITTLLRRVHNEAIEEAERGVQHELNENLSNVTAWTRHGALQRAKACSHESDGIGRALEVVRSLKLKDPEE